MLRDGTLNEKDDLMLLKKITSPDFELPMFPVWDPEGMLIKQAGKASNFLEMLPTYIIRGLWNPRRLALNPSEAKRIGEFQNSLKAKILKRMLPGLRDWTDEQVSEHFLKDRRSPLDPSGKTIVSDSYWSQFKGVRDGLESKQNHQVF